MKILLSAYACEPNKGSEPGVGWNWALALARRGYEVHVLTRSNNRESIEQERGRWQGALHFHFFDLPNWAKFWKHWPGGIYLYYLLWQIGASRIAMRLHEQERFEVVQHITFVSYRQPSFMGKLGIPFIFGPVGGGESMPRQLRAKLPLRARLAEGIRDAGNRFVSIDPLMRGTYADAKVIACATAETMQAIPAQFRGKCVVQRAIGMDQPAAGTPLPLRVVTGEAALQFLFVGRLLYWKGLHLALHALGRVKAEIPDVKLRIIGEGGDGGWLRAVAVRAGVADRLEWVPRIAHNAMQTEYRNCVALLFPSLHDSGGMVVLEALASSLPVVCLDRGGPGSMVDSSCGFVVPTGGRSENDVIEELAASMIRLLRESERQSLLAEGALKRAREMSWDAAAEAVYSTPVIVELTGRSAPVASGNETVFKR